MDPVLNLGNLALSGFPTESIPGNLPFGEKVPLDLCACVDCQLVQLSYSVDPDRLFKHHYWYRSGINELMRAELADVVRQGIAHVESLGIADYVMDTGANDGTLLAEYRNHAKARDVARVAYEPAHNLQAQLNTRAEDVYEGYFPPPAQNLAAFAGRVTAMSCAMSCCGPLIWLRGNTSSGNC